MIILRVIVYFCLINFTFVKPQPSTGFWENYFSRTFQRLCFCRCGISTMQTRTIRNGRLIGGDLTTPHQFPWLVTVNTGSRIIGGALISERHVITAASPLQGIAAGKIVVTLGDHDRCSANGDIALNSSVAAVIAHPNYLSSNTMNDIALLRLRHVVSFSQYISPICMPYFDFQNSGQVAWTASWIEKNASNTCIPRVASHPILSPELCVRGAMDAKMVTSDKGCLGPLGAKSIICKEDVGAPLMWHWSPGAPFRLVGVIAAASSCEDAGTPLYTRIVDHLSWIREYTRSDCQCF